MIERYLDNLNFIIKKFSPEINHYLQKSQFFTVLMNKNHPVDYSYFHDEIKVKVIYLNMKTTTTKLELIKGDMYIILKAHQIIFRSLTLLCLYDFEVWNTGHSFPSTLDCFRIAMSVCDLPATGSFNCDISCSHYVFSKIC